MRDKIYEYKSHVFDEGILYRFFQHHKFDMKYIQLFSKAFPCSSIYLQINIYII